MRTIRSKGRALVGVALADLRHEWILTLCQALALAAVLGPLLLLLGLKNGIVETMRDRLVQDPVYREITPDRATPIADTFFEDMVTRDDVAFVTPNALNNAALGHAFPVDDPQRRARVEALPTASDDPLMLENGAQIPVEGEAVVTASLASTLGIGPGNAIAMEINRLRNRRREKQQVPLTVVSVLAPRADSLERLYVPLGLIDDIERYKEGAPVENRGWEGTPPRPAPLFDGALIVSSGPISGLETLRLTLNTGFSAIAPASPDAAADLLGIPVAGEPTVFRLDSISTIGFDGPKALTDKLRGRDAVVLPFAEDLEGTVENGAPFHIAGLSTDPETAAFLGFETPWPVADRRIGTPSLDKVAAILLPEAVRATLPEDARTVLLRLEGAKEALSVPLRIEGTAPADEALVPVALAGALRAARERPVRYDTATNELVPVFSRYGFRLYAKRIEGVADLVAAIEERGMDVNAKTQDIDRLIELDRILTAMFWLIAAAGIAGSIAALAASLYGAVERKIAEISMLRLLGFSRGNAFAFPLAQAIVIALAALVLSFAIFFGFGWLINAYFAERLGLGADICRLPATTLAAATTAALVCAGIASLFAAARATSIDPAEAIRIE